MGLSATKKSVLLYAELTLLFILAPLLYKTGLIGGPKFLALLLGLIYTFGVMVRGGIWHGEFWRLRFNTYLSIILIRFTAIGIILTMYVWYFERDHFLVLPRNHTELWLAIMVFYPIFSAFPQEFIYRVYFTQRFGHLFKNEWWAAAVNALLFGWLHIIFQNPVAVAGGFLMGLFWFFTYHKTQSLWAVTMEHAIYGNLIYTLGWGHYFYVPDF